MEKIENKEAGILYEKVKSVFFSFKDVPTYKYDKHQHHLYEESEHPGISRDFYNENGSVEFVNSKGDTIVFELSRFHTHQHNGWSGLCGSPCRLITISKKCGEELEELWRLEVVCRTLHYEGNVTFNEVPYDLLKKEEVKTEVEVSDSDISNNDIGSDSNSDNVVEDNDLNIELVDIKEKYGESIQERDRLIEERDREINLAIKKIKDSYDGKIGECNEDIESYKLAIEKYDNVVSAYSTFDSNVIGVAIQYLMSMIECSSYSYIEVPYYFKKRVHGTIDSWDEDCENYIGVVVPTSDKVNYFKNIDLDDLIDKGACLLYRDSKRNKSVTFYSSRNGKYIYNQDFSKYPYIKDFIDYVIKYRFKNKKNDISSHEIVDLLHLFLEGYQDKILERYSSSLKNKIYSIQF